MNIDLSLPVYCGGEEVKDVFKFNHFHMIWESYKGDEVERAWDGDGTPLGDWPPLTNEPPVAHLTNQASKPQTVDHIGVDASENTPPVKPEVDKSEPEVKQYTTRIAELEAMVRELRGEAEFHAKRHCELRGLDFSKFKYVSDLIARSKKPCTR
jgi:hypothetical protein